MKSSIPLRSIDYLRLYRFLFDNSKRDTKTILSTNDFIYRCINENGMPLCVRKALAIANPKFRYFKTEDTTFDVGNIAKEFPLALQTHCYFYDLDETALIRIECHESSEIWSKSSKLRRANINKIFNVKSEYLPHIPPTLLSRIQDFAIDQDGPRTRIFLINSYSNSDANFAQFKAFANTLGMPFEKDASLSRPSTIKLVTGDLCYDDKEEDIKVDEIKIRFYLGWINNHLVEGFED